MCRPPKARPTGPELALYALAQVKAQEVERVMSSRCSGCSGERCDQPMRVPVAGRADWPACPLAMLRAPSWRSLVDTFLAARISPLAGWPDAYTAWAVEGLVELHSAIRTDEEQQRKAPAPGGPVFSGRRTTRG